MFCASLSDGLRKVWLRSANTFRVNGLLNRIVAELFQSNGRSKRGHTTATQPKGYNDRRTERAFDDKGIIKMTGLR